MNWYGIKSIFTHELDRFRRTIFQSLASPIITTSLYFVVFGSAIGSRITQIDGINYGEVEFGEIYFQCQASQDSCP